MASFLLFQIRLVLKCYHYQSDSIFFYISVIKNKSAMEDGMPTLIKAFYNTKCRFFFTITYDLFLKNPIITSYLAVII